MVPVIYRDEHFIAINKPTGLLVHRSSIDKSSREFAVQTLRNQIGTHVYPVHRLDKPTSGVLLFGLSSEAARLAGFLFSSRQVHKMYVAVVRGYLLEQGKIDYPLKAVDDLKSKKKAVSTRPPQEAITVYKPIAKIELPYPVGRYETCRYSLIELYPETGRKHQLRRHMKHIFHPILGDTRYGDWRHNKFLNDQFGCTRMLLHASELRFQHPINHTTIHLKAAPDEAFESVIKEMKLNYK